MQKHSSPREVGAQKQNEEKKSVSYSNPLTSIYSALTTSWGRCEHHRNGPRTNQEGPRGGCSPAATRSVWPTCGVGRPLMGPRDGNGLGSDRVECLGTQNRNPNIKSETDPNTDSGENSCPKPNPQITETRLDTRNPLRMVTYEEQSRLL
jgi:hypothetical protein